MVKGIAHSKTPNLQIQGEFHQTEFIISGFTRGVVL